ncbi:uncharacterized protein EDB91DRAFT_900096 [Suillus paluster]|uniref:uncharacterized protein n=1 Tax=Suillus paluster TaxID=48578 RepID=UPI001B86ADBE|nr:uncharacterized protein EDB91DRAFT_900096 [Suillus paluster]KAG1726994.1 hypothetical protein EDB91DRAFT_900096 [Suillus paluster]
MKLCPSSTLSYSLCSFTFATLICLRHVTFVPRSPPALKAAWLSSAYPLENAMSLIMPETSPLGINALRPLVLHCCPTSICTN